MKLVLETHRLQLRELTVADAPFMLALLNSPGWLQHIGDRGVTTVEQAAHYLQNGILKSYKEKGFGFWGIQLKGSQNLIGICGLIKREGLPAVDMGYALLPHYWGQGYALESATATLTYAQQVLGLDPILAITTTINQASKQLLQKIGLVQKGTTILPGSSEELLLFTTL
jgi:RimJ/RimL family protein N-acetyltransferase